MPIYEDITVTDRYGSHYYWHICGECAAVVANTNVHDNLHERIESLWGASPLGFMEMLVGKLNTETTDE